MKAASSKPPLPKAAQLRSRRLLMRLGMLAVLAVSLWLLWWSVFVRLAPVNREYQSRTQQLSDLANQVDQLRLQWPASKLDQAEKEFQAARALLFTNTTEAADWGRQIQSEAAAAGLQASISWDAPQVFPPAELKLSTAQARLSLQPVVTPGVTNAPYLRLLNLARKLGNGDKRVDMLSLAVNGGSNAVQQADLVLQVWTQERSEK